MSVCKRRIEHMQQYRLSPKAYAKDLLSDYANHKPLTARERERVDFALRFINDIPQAIERIEAEVARKVLQKMASL